VFRAGVVLPGEVNHSPIVRINNVTFCYVKVHHLFVAATTSHNADCLSIFEFLNRYVPRKASCLTGSFTDILEIYLEGKLDQKHVEARLSLLHELVEGKVYEKANRSFKKP
jgi:hypothetical protein